MAAGLSELGTRQEATRGETSPSYSASSCNAVQHGGSRRETDHLCTTAPALSNCPPSHSRPAWPRTIRTRPSAGKLGSRTAHKASESWLAASAYGCKIRDAGMDRALNRNSALALPTAATRVDEYGSAAGTERVCTYMYIVGVRRRLKKTK